jgi:hypothetical protein
MSLVLARAAGADIVGAVPKAASQRGLRCAPDPVGCGLYSHGGRVAAAD